MKHDLLDSGMSARLAYLATTLSYRPSTGQELDEYIQTIVSVVLEAERLVPGIGFRECAAVINGEQIVHDFASDSFAVGDEDEGTYSHGY